GAAPSPACWPLQRHETSGEPAARSAGRRLRRGERHDSRSAGLRIERIVSLAQESPPGFWYDQPQAEWVLLLAGAARLRFADEDEERALGPGDWVHIAAHRRHRVAWTDPEHPTVWLAVFHL